MRPTVRQNDSLSRQSFERRADTRMATALPILIEVNTVRYNALLCNLSNAGAKIDTSAPIMIRSKIEMHCGSICTNGTVLWRTKNTFGIRFSHPITDQQLSEQVSRSEAAASLRARPVREV